MAEATVAAARRWLAEDPDPQTRAELQQLLEAGDTRELTDRFAAPLQFGTAGLRGAMGAGPNRMNRAVVIRTTAGLASYLRDHGGRRVVVGYDARHRSSGFARDTAAVLAGAGLSALVVRHPLPTPVVPFAIGRLDADAGVVVTASHNPARDNGYKVYLGDGSQIVPPADADIAAAIAAVGSLAAVPRSAGWSVLPDDVVSAYVDRVASLPHADGPRDLRLVYTPLHGVGAELVAATLARAGFDPPTMVAEQAAPDPDFPTVDFPNPEEPGAMDLALALAADVSADLVVANDPDADRCAVGVPDGDGWRMLSGDDVGALLGAHLLGKGVTGTLASSVVSSSLLARMAAAHDVDYVETLTGFKWIGRVPGLAFGYEEALGYCVDPVCVRDKDGISALVLVAELAAELKSAGRTLSDALNDIAGRYGVHATEQVSVRLAEVDQAAAVMTRLRTEPPAVLGGLAVEVVDDLAVPGGALPPTDALRYRLAGGARVVVRPSGTEPKLKGYIEVVESAVGDVAGARAAAARVLARLRRDVAAALAVSPTPP